MAAATDPLMNFAVDYGTFGPFAKGDVVPLYWLEGKKHHVDTLIANGVGHLTTDPVNCAAKLLAEQPRTSTDPTPGLQAEVQRLTAENTKLAADNKLLLGRADAAERESKAKDDGIGKQLAEIGRLTALVNGYTAENAKLHAELDAATQPAGK